MTVAELIAVLQTCDQALPVATYANHHEYMSGIDAGTHGAMRVVLLHTYGGPHVLIGNVSRKNLNGANWHVAKELDGGCQIAKEWPRWDGRSWDFREDFGPVCAPSMKCALDNARGELEDSECST